MSPRIVKRCTCCGRLYTTTEWLALPLHGRQHAPGLVLDLKNCACRGTMAKPNLLRSAVGRSVGVRHWNIRRGRLSVGFAGAVARLEIMGRLVTVRLSRRGARRVLAANDLLENSPPESQPSRGAIAGKGRQACPAGNQSNVSPGGPGAPSPRASLWHQDSNDAAAGNMPNGTER